MSDGTDPDDDDAADKRICSDCIGDYLKARVEKAAAQMFVTYSDVMNGSC
jgi:hypothetical protein